MIEDRKENHEVSPEVTVIEVLLEEIKTATQREPELALALRSIVWGGSRGLEENRLMGN